MNAAYTSTPFRCDMTAYSTQRVKSGLLHFGVGKLGSGVVGIALLLLLVRLLPASDYATMVTMVAAFEIASLALNLGVLPATWRFLPEARSAGTARDVSAVAWLSIGGRALPVLAGGISVALAPSVFGPWMGRFTTQGDILIYCFAAMLCVETICRHVDLVFELLLLQRVSQLLILARGAARLIALLLLSNWGSRSIDVGQWALIEVAVGTVGMLLGLVLLYVQVLRHRMVDDDPAKLPSMRRVLNFALPAYGAQLLGTAQGFDACKIVIAQVSSPAVVSAVGFTISMATTLQRYLPSYLLVGFVRPLFVHSSVGAGNAANGQFMASILLKFNLLFLLPAICMAAIVGPELVGWLSGGRVAVTELTLVLALGALCLQTLHMVLGLLALSVEDSVSGLKGTAFGAALFVAGAALSGTLGPNGLLALISACELVWCITVAKALQRKSAAPQLAERGMWCLAAATLAAIASGFSVANIEALNQHTRTVLSAMACVLVFAVVVVRTRPLSDGERRLVAKLIPERLLIL